MTQNSHNHQSNRHESRPVHSEDRDLLMVRANLIDLATYREARASLQGNPEISQAEVRQEALRQAQIAGSQIVQNTAEVPVQLVEPTAELSEFDQSVQDALNLVDEAHRGL